VPYFWPVLPGVGLLTFARISFASGNMDHVSFCAQRLALIVLFAVTLSPATLSALSSAQSSSSSSKPTKKSPATAKPTLDPGAISNNIYRNKALSLTCKIPEAWVFRTDEMNVRNEEAVISDPAPNAPADGKVLLATFSRPPAAKGEEVNSSIIIAAEPVASYPGLKDPAQYFGPLTEVAKAQGFAVDADPYEIAIDAKTLVRADYHKDVGSRVMHQSTLAFLAHGYAISITLIAGTDDDVEELIDGLSFTNAGKK
jgi:hypothetical protein